MALHRAIAALQTRVRELEHRPDPAAATAASFVLDPRLDGNRRRIRSLAVLVAIVVAVFGSLLGTLMFAGG